MDTRRKGSVGLVACTVLVAVCIEGGATRGPVPTTGVLAEAWSSPAASTSATSPGTSPPSPVASASPSGFVPATSVRRVGRPLASVHVASPDVRVAGPVTIGVLANADGQDAYLGDTARYRWIVLQEGEGRDIAAIKAANPDTKVLAYENAAVTDGPGSCQDDGHPAAGVSWCFANTYHPEWFLTDSRGNRLTYKDFPADYAMDVGNAAYQGAWRSNVAAILRRDGWDGVFIDDVNTFPGHGLNGRVARYSDAQYGQAMSGFVRAVAPALRNAGLLTVGNVAADPWTAWQESTAEQIAGSIGGFFREYWQRWGAGSNVFTGAMWSSLMAQAERVQAAGAAYLGNTYGTMSESAVMVYARASWLLAWNGASGASLWDPGNTGAYSPAWTASIGMPLARRYAVGAGWRRDFSDGIALVDPSSTAAQTFPLNGTYALSTGGTVSGSITLQPGTAAILLPAG